MAFGTTLCILFLCITISCSSGSDFTFEHHEQDPSDTTQSRHRCGVARCTETLGDTDLSGNNKSTQLTSLKVYKTRVGRDGTIGHWQQVASITPQQPSLNRVSDGMKVTGELTEQQATISLELVKTQDCLQTRFSCVAVSVNSQGRASVKKSLVGEAIESHLKLDPQFHEERVSMPFMTNHAIDGQFGSRGTLAQMMGAFQAKFDRVEDFFRSIENRLEDKLGDLDNKMDAKFETLDFKMNNLQNRLEDKVVHLDARVTEALSQIKKTNSGDTRVCDLLTTKLEALEEKQKESHQQLGTCVAEIIKLSRDNNNCTGTLSGHLTTLTMNLQSMKENFVSLNEHLGTMESATNKCVTVFSHSGDHDRLRDLRSSVTNLSYLTEDLAKEFNTFKVGYSGGALVPVEEFFDLLGTGKKEWRLAFRGTPYNNIQVYPAFMHGTGIPVEVEEGCKQFNRSLPCTNHYRNTDAFYNWAKVDEVLLGIFKDDRMVHRIVFNGKSTTYAGWFTEGRVIDSSWDDLTTKSHNFFSIDGDYSASTHRRFYVSYDHDKGCNGYRGWFKASDTNQGCASEKTASFPTFFYATGKTFAVWPSPNAGQADAIGIFIKYE
ncbi:hypothetical protein ElyMa_005856700 [Elysia marginata]|uniref:Fibrinogen C-terminal domain-containing protein n=1 Tax=Elysia marginata TaxID=1093978 RepID=A0AAV4FZQ7_9GAST|nr:hypothetical protein ElyMa_005856700 [Elysia marginata]